jgi:hypothetical protein
MHKYLHRPVNNRNFVFLKSGVVGEMTYFKLQRIGNYEENTIYKRQMRDDGH